MNFEPENSIRRTILLPKVPSLTSLLAVLLAFVGQVTASVRLNRLFTDNMVLQCDKPVPIWGTADPGERVTVRVAGRRASATPDAAGRWQVKLNPIPAGGPYSLQVQGFETQVLSNVMIGEVWICSGQSNMSYSMRLFPSYADTLAKANFPDIRLFGASEPDGWRMCDSASLRTFSAVGFFFGKNIQMRLGITVGIIEAAQSGTEIERWMPKTSIIELPELKYNPSSYGDLFKAYVHPLAPFAIRGFLWYQGEQNVNLNRQCYLRFFNAMIWGWRKVWDQEDLPFLYVQLANYLDRQADPMESRWAELREAQRLAAAIPNTGMAVTIDIGEAYNIHPINKHDVGRRLSLLARALVYHEDIEYSGPDLKSSRIDSGKAVLNFTHVGSGLVAKGNGRLVGFSISGADNRFHWADAEILDGNQVHISCPQVPEPTQVRYGWADNPELNLYNSEGLPASPFSTASEIPEFLISGSQQVIAIRRVTLPVGVSRGFYSLLGRRLEVTKSEGGEFLVLRKTFGIPFQVVHPDD